MQFLVESHWFCILIFAPSAPYIIIFFCSFNLIYLVRFVALCLAWSGLAWSGSVSGSILRGPLGKWPFISFCYLALSQRLAFGPVSVSFSVLVLIQDSLSASVSVYIPFTAEMVIKNNKSPPFFSLFCFRPNGHHPLPDFRPLGFNFFCVWLVFSTNIGQKHTRIM